MANKKYDKAFKQQISKLHLEGGRTLASLSKEYSIAKSTLTGWIKIFSEESTQSEDKVSSNVYEEIKLLKKGGSLLRQGNRQLVYQFIELNKLEFGVRWLLRHFEISPNGYYNYLKHRNLTYNKHKQLIKNQIKQIYHSKDRKMGYRMINSR